VSYIHQLAIICEVSAADRVSAIAQSYGVAGSGFRPQCELTSNGTTATHLGMNVPITEAMRQGLLMVSAEPGNLIGVYYLITPNAPGGEVAGSNIQGWEVIDTFDFDDLRVKLSLERLQPNRNL